MQLDRDFPGVQRTDRNQPAHQTFRGGSLKTTKSQDPSRPLGVLQNLHPQHSECEGGLETATPPTQTPGMRRFAICIGPLLQSHMEMSA